MPIIDLSGRSALITGASQGLGLAIAKTLAKAGADIFICSRTTADLEKAVDEIKNECATSDQKVHHLTADVSVPDEVERLIAKVLSVFPNLTILVSNAGVYGPMGKIDEIDWSDFTKAIEINLYGPILLTRALLHHFRHKGYGKIIQISGGGATNPLPRLESYAASKAGVVRFFESLALDAADCRLDVNSISPGLLDTRLLNQVINAGPKKVGDAFYNRMVKSKDAGLCSDLGLASKLCLFLASSASDGITGKLISAVWDDYESWPLHLKELTGGDLYTLRRITGRDRQTDWGDK